MGFTERQYLTMLCPECNVSYCTSCNQVEHPEKTCEEARREKERLADPVHRAHEIMSTAVKRRCPNCAKEFVKSDGCNKMTCTCGTFSCYLCGVKVKDYSHFCTHTGTCKCKKDRCKLWVSTQAMEERDRKARHEAGRKELEAAGIPEDEIRRILASPPRVAVANNVPIQRPQPVPIRRPQPVPVQRPQPVPIRRPQPRQGQQAAVLGPGQPQPQGIIDRMFGEAGCIIS